jgi:hypothetical protein
MCKAKNGNSPLTLEQAIYAIRIGLFCDGYTDEQIIEKEDWIYHRALQLSESAK